MQIKGIFVFNPYQTGGEPAGNKKEDSNMAFFDRVDGLISTPRHGSMICRQLSIIKASVPVVEWISRYMGKLLS